MNTGKHLESKGGEKGIYKKKKIPIKIIIGKTYKNFADNWRTVLAVTENSDAVRVTYEDGTGAPRTCEIGTFRQWVKKNYY